MRQKLNKLRFAPIAVQAVFSAALIISGPASPADGSQDYFYLKQAASGNSRNSCSSVFADINKGKEGDVGDIIRSLKTINVSYLLDDYDNSRGTDRRKKVFELDDLLAEVEMNKREIYCKIELAAYMKSQNYLADPVYGDLLSDAFSELTEVYSAAKKSYATKDFARARYAFDLIAPYRDAYQLSLQAVAALDSAPVEKTASGPAGPETVPAMEDITSSGEAGPIALAVSMTLPAPKMSAMTSPGPIALAALPGAITAAANSHTAAGRPEEFDGTGK